MSARLYHFRSDWLVESAVERALEVGSVYDVLQDVAAYPSWWRSVPYVARLDHDVALVGCRSRLPKTLEVELRPVVQDREAGVLHASLEGELRGWSRFELALDARGVAVAYTQEVSTPGRLMGVAGRVARPVLEWNHEQMMRALRIDLSNRLAS